MKLLGKKFLCILFTFCMISSTIHVSALTESSNYLDSYRAITTAESGGKIVVTVDVSGVGYQKEIGATYIIIYESSDNKLFKQVAWYDVEDYPKMMSSGTFYYADAATYYGKVGYYYFASVYCYAGDGTNGDERNYKTVAVRAIT